MSGYSAFAQFYDMLMNDVDYAARADYLMSLFFRHNSQHKTKTLLDLACGSGNLALELARRGVDIIGVDSSDDMLSAARDKADEAGIPLLLICQDMRSLDLYGTVDGAVCCLDGINHICRTSELTQIFERLYLFIEPGGLFIFDANTVYKHLFVLGNNSFVYEMKDVFCVWRNSLNKHLAKVEMILDFFKREKDGKYIRLTDSLSERAYSVRTLKRLLSSAGFDTLAVYDDLSYEQPKDDSSRVVFVARRKNKLKGFN